MSLPRPAPAPPAVRLWFWALPVLLTAVQAAFTLASLPLVRFEEVAESVRNVWWLEQGALYDGISSNVSWYALLLAVYRSFGFTLATARWVRLLLHGVSLLCLAAVLRRQLGARRALLPLLAVGLSPSWLFFDTVATTYALDLVALPGLLALLLLPPPRWRAAAGVAYGLLAMAAAMAYPVALFYLPLLAWLWWRRTAAAGRGAARWAPLLAFPVPLLAALLWLRTPLLLHDPHTGSGIFRGGGGSFTLDPGTVGWNLLRVLRDLFVRGRSYYFWIDAVELDGVLGALAAVTVAAGTALLWRRRPQLRTLLGLAMGLAGVNLLLVSASLGPQGLRRCTTLLAAFYLAYALVWALAAGDSLGGPRWLRGALMAGCLALPVHHAAAAARNLPAMPRLGAEQAQVWLAVDPTAQQALARWLAHTAAGRPLDCAAVGLAPERCHYGGIFAVVAGYRHWNDLAVRPIFAREPHTDDILELEISLWQEGRLAH